MVETGATRQVAMVQGLLTIEGVPERFVQGFGRRLRLSAGDLRHVAGVASRDGRLDDATRILGRARLVGDRLQRAGFAGEAGQIGLTLRSLAPSEDGRILMLLGFRDDDADGGGFFCDIFAPPPVFEALSDAVHAGTAQALSVSAATSLWVRESQRDAVPDLPVDWHLGLEPNGRDSTPARGRVETLEWHLAPAPSPEPGAPAEDEPHETTADQLSALNWSLKQIALVLTFLLIVVALK
ncbi:hypothetical protein [Bosea sp. (in: a-proteobacteria)]|uniref:hypothetical protein n=1 Tax=Bosea sp. (in: a-proteobacteria) TaxID=1871050 RepID=UPI002732E9E6|nr:hypothetical protein [Bosea sp. (in: a-proteobacteria)]MDP3407380.1 hypothetical protein [Bosea sp. (in: a-proteobacteria)]